MPYTWLVQLPGPCRGTARRRALADPSSPAQRFFLVVSASAPWHVTVALRGLLALALVLAALDLGVPWRFGTICRGPDGSDVVRAGQVGRASSSTYRWPWSPAPTGSGIPSDDEAMLRAIGHEHDITFRVIRTAHSNLLVAPATNRYYDDLMLPSQRFHVCMRPIPLSEGIQSSRQPERQGPDRRLGRRPADDVARDSDAPAEGSVPVRHYLRGSTYCSRDGYVNGGPSTSSRKARR